MLTYDELYLTDGTTTVDLLSLATPTGAHLRTYRPSSSRQKGGGWGGAWHDSALASGQRPAFYAWDAVEARLGLDLVGWTENDVSDLAAKIRNLLQAARDYFVGGLPNASPVYLIRRASGQTTREYSLVLAGTAPEDADYAAAFEQYGTVGYENWECLIVREAHWRDTIPAGEGVCLPNAGYQSVCRPCFVEFAANGIITTGNGAPLDNLAAGGNGMTAEAWVRIDTVSTCEIINKGLAGPAGWDMSVTLPVGAIYATIYCLTLDGIQCTVNGTLTADGLWHHVAFTWDDATDLRPHIWVDGVEAAYNAGGGQDRNGVIVADAGHDLLIGNNVALTMDLLGAVAWVRASDTERYVGAFTPDSRCTPPAVDANTMGQWVGEACAGTFIRNVADDATFDGTLANGTFDCDCLDWVGNIDPTDDSVDYTCEEDGIEAFIRNAHVRAAITQIWHVDTSTGNWTGNLAEEDAYELLPNPVENGDFLYIGIDDASQFYGPFNNVVFDLDAVGVSIGGQWAYSAWWAPLDIHDGTLLLNTTGICAVTFPIAAVNDWVPAVVHGITAYWFRFQVIGAPGNPQPPVQQNRPVYTTNWAYTEFEAANVPGDVPALARILNVVAGEGQTTGTTVGMMPARVLLALRSKDRGADFVPFFNFGDPSVPGVVGAQAQIGVTPAVGAQGTQSTASQRQQGVQVTGQNTIIDTWQPVQSWAIAQAYAPQYYGTYRVFFRGKCIAHAGTTLKTRVHFSMASGIFATTKEIDWIHDTWNNKLYDLGSMILPPYAPAHATDLPRTALTITVQQYTSNIADSMFYYDLIILPVDEKVVEAITSPPGMSALTFTVTSRLLFDSTTTLKTGTLRTLALDDNGAVTGYWRPISAGPAWFQVNANQRLWMLSEWYYAASSVWWSSHETHLKILLKRIARYQSLRGSR